MQLQTTENYHKEKIHIRIPAGLKKILAEEALVRGMNLSEYSSMLLVSTHQHGAQQTAELSLALKENENLRKEIQKLKEQLVSESELEKGHLAKLRRNRDILLQFLGKGSATKAQLKEAGFVPTCLSGIVKLNGMTCTANLDMAYSINGELVTITKL